MNEAPHRVKKEIRVRQPPALSAILIALAALSLSLGPAARAGQFTLASFSSEYVPDAELSLTGEEEDEIGTSALTNTLKFAVPVSLSGHRTMLLNFFTLRSLSQSYDDVSNSPGTFRPAKLYTLKYGLVFHHALSDRWNLSTLLQPAILSDFREVDSDHFSLRAGFIFEKKSSDKLKYGFGAGYSDDFGKESILPALRIDWKVGDDWRLKIDIPQKVEGWYSVSNNIDMGIVGKATGGHFRIGEDVDLGEGKTTRGGSVKYSIVNIGPAVEFPFMGPTSLTLNGGRSVYRHYRVFDADEKTLLDSDYENSYFFKATLKFQVTTGS